MEFIEPSGVAADGFGNFLVGDSKNNKIKVKMSHVARKPFLGTQTKLYNHRTWLEA